MPLNPVLLAGLLRTCAPNVDPRTEAAVVEVESGGNSWALHSNTPNRSYAPRTFAEAVRIGDQLVAADRGRDVDVGLAQVNSRNFPTYGVSVVQMLDPCTNLKVSAAILADDYAREWTASTAVAEPQRAQVALRRALQDYNAGTPTAAPGYTDAILRSLGSPLVRATLAALGTPIHAEDERTGHDARPTSSPPERVASTSDRTARHSSSVIFSHTAAASLSDPTPLPDPALLGSRLP